MFYEAICYDKININRGGEGSAGTQNLRYPKGTHTHTHTHTRIAMSAVGRVHVHAAEA